jgi:hypothetical protein
MKRSRFIGLAAGVIALSASAGRDWAQDNELNVQFHAFKDTRGVTVLTPTADLARDFSDRTNLRVNFGIDAISAASDSCARCHREGVNSQRGVGGLSVTEKFPSFKLTIGGAYSIENFYRATTLITSASRDLANGNATVAGGYSFSLNRPTLHPTENVESQYQQGAFVSFTQTLSKSTIAQVGYEFGAISGYQNNPFLRANVNGTMTLGQVPDSRTRQTLTARLRQALPAESSLQADYRHYVDDWQIHSDTLTVGLSHRFASQLTGAFDYRRYLQTAAYFYQPEYSGPVPKYFTADFRLAPFGSDLYTGRLTITPGGSFLSLPVESALTLQYDRYVANNGFQAAIFSAGVRIPFK